MKKIRMEDFERELSRWGTVFKRTEEGFMEKDTLFSGRSRQSPKEFLLPREEVLFVARKSKDDVEILPSKPSKKKVVFGALPCDMKGLELTSKNFMQDPQDPYFKKRMENTLFVSEMCQYPSSSCFCRTFGFGPRAQMGDITYFKLDEDTVLTIPLTDKGKHALKWENYPEAEPQDLKIMENVLSEVEKKVEKLDLSYDFNRQREVYGSDVLNESVFHCINCGACTFVCPTCYCFDIRDVKRKDFVIRERVWDSCMYFVYSLEASGHNPRKERTKRAQNRFMHKFFYQPLQYKEYGCTGCGRCIDTCPAGYDIRQTVLKIQSFLEGQNG